MKIVINICFGGFGLSDAQGKALGLVGTPKPYKLPSAYRSEKETEFYWDVWDMNMRELRTNPILIASVEAGDRGGEYSKLSVVEIPDNVHWQIHEYDGAESVIWSESEIHWV